jgi:hypothetical protein
LKTSPWIILGSTVILLIAVIVFAVQNSHREKKDMSQLMSTKGAALIRAVEAGARAGMMGMMWGGQQIQRLLEETGRLPDVLYMAVVEENGIVIAHSDPSKINTPFRQNKKLSHLGPDLKENWELVDLVAGRRSFEVHRHFRPLASGRVGAKTGNAGHPWLGAQAYAHHYGKRLPTYDEWQVIKQQFITVPDAIQKVADDNMHSHMQMGELSPKDSPIEHEKMVVKEWLSTGTSDLSSDSHVVEWFRGNPDQNVTKRYPWEGFYDVGFRTILDAGGAGLNR